MPSNREKLGMKAALRKFEHTKLDKRQDKAGAKAIMKKASGRKK